MRRRDLRSNIGMVLQDTWLFGGTIRENIAYGNLDATEEQILEAARATYVDRFVHSLPDGYDTVIDDEGGTVSAGEKQLLTIARAFLADPTILILDEATSSVDTRTEVLIQQAMAALRSQPHELRDRPPAVDDPRRRHHPRDGARPASSSRATTTSCSPRGGAYANLYNAQFAGARRRGRLTTPSPPRREISTSIFQRSSARFRAPESRRRLGVRTRTGRPRRSRHRR